MTDKSTLFDKVCKSLLAIILALAAAAACIPFIYMFLLSLTQSETMVLRFSEISLDFASYKSVFAKTAFAYALKNSIIVSFFACIINNIVCAMAAYGFEKKKFRGSKQLFALYLATMAVPGQVTLIPTFIIFKNLGLMNTYVALILPIVNAFGIFLVRQFMTAVPDELLEAAQIDGAKEFRIFASIVLPLIKPVLVSLTVFTFISTWNNFLWPLVITSGDKMQTLTLALSTLKNNFTTDYGLVMAGSVLTFAFPFILYCILQKQFVEGIALSGIKG